MKKKKLKKERKNNKRFYIKYRKTNNHIYIYIYYEKKILFCCSTVEKKIKKLNLIKDFYSIEILSKFLILKLKNRNIFKIDTLEKKKNVGKYNFLLNLLKKNNFL